VYGVAALEQTPLDPMLVTLLYDPVWPTLLYLMALTGWQYQLPPERVEPEAHWSARAPAPKARTIMADCIVNCMIAVV
jgi:hypothetical protein